MAGTIRFRDLGTLVLERDGEPLPVGGARLAAALALLLVHIGRAVSVDALAEAMSGGEVTPRSTSTLDSHVWRLRRLLEPDRARGAPAEVLLRDPGDYRLLATAEQVDSMRFVRLAAARAHNQRAGMRWPNREITTALVARATDALDRVEFEDAWQAGSRLTLDDLGVAVVERAPLRPG